ncbi:hypothetical protein BH10PSE16_BH10PSE16_02800 [soil metagenome]
MLIFSNREHGDRAGASGFKPKPAAGAAPLSLATLERMAQDTAGHWRVSQIDSDVEDADSMRALLPMFQKSGPLFVYLHGYNSTPVACFERCDRLQSLYGLEVVRFSWSSKKHRLGECDPPDFMQRFSERQGLESNGCLRPLDPAADLEAPTCSWWLVMALPGSASSLQGGPDATQPEGRLGMSH